MFQLIFKFITFIAFKTLKYEVKKVKLAAIKWFKELRILVIGI